MNLGRIYKIKSEHNNDCYIGSTINNLNNRLSLHKSSYKRYLDGKYGYVSSFDIIKNGNYNIELLEEINFLNKQDLLNRERHYIENEPNCINKNITGRSRAETAHAYYMKIKNRSLV